MRHMVIAIVLLATAVAAGQEWEGDLFDEGGELHGMVGVGFDSKYIWRGFDFYDDRSTLNLMADLNLFESGFGASAVGHYPDPGGDTWEDYERWDFALYYQNGMFPGEAYATNYRVGWMYYNFPSLEPEQYDLQEGHAVFSWPNIMPIKGLQPSYAIIKLWPSKGGSLIEGRRPSTNVSAWLHILMLDYGFTVPGIAPDTNQLVVLHAELVYNDGFSPRGDNVDHDFSHTVVGASTDFMLLPNLALTPAIYYQFTLNDSISPWDKDDEWWTSLNLKYSF